MAWAELTDAVLRYELLGSAGRPVMLVHEMGGTLESWDLVAPELAQNLRVLRMDLRNCGLSEFHPLPLTIDVLTADLAALIDQLNVGDDVLVAGCAVGAAVALAFAADFPGRTAGVVAMAPATGLPVERRPAALERADHLEAAGMRPSVDSRLLSSYPENLRGNAERFAEVRRRRLAASPWGMATQTRMLAAMDLTGRLAKIACPVLCVAGSSDGDRPPPVVRQVADAIPGAQYAEIPSGHFMPLQNPDQVVRLITNFEASLPRGE